MINLYNNINLFPLITYYNTYVNKSNILRENKNKSGIYRWLNLITGKSYIGSSINLNVRLRAYYCTSNLNRIVNKEQSIICEALLKYGHKNFSLDILEYCEIDILIEREQYYLDHLKPEYNILKFAGSRFGSVLSEKTRKAISIALRGKKYTGNNKENLRRNVIMSKIKPGICVKVFDKSNKFIKEFYSIKSAARYLDISDRTIRGIRDRGISYDNYIYIFEGLQIWVYDNKKEIINTLSSKKRVSEVYDIPCTTLSRYIKSGKLYKNKFYFCMKQNISI